MTEIPITSGLIVFLLMVFGALAGLWWRIEGRIKMAEKEASDRAAVAVAQAHLTASQLAEYKTHVAETYVSKTGMREMRDEIMTGVRDLKGSVTTIHERIDQMILGTSDKRTQRQV